MLRKAVVALGLQSFVVGPGDAATSDLISPRAGVNAIVTHSLRSAMSGATAVILFSDEADPQMALVRRFLFADERGVELQLTDDRSGGVTLEVSLRETD